jgi:hypothetical protein
MDTKEIQEIEFGVIEFGLSCLFRLVEKSKYGRVSLCDTYKLKY